jgi:hypothetical protein
MRRSLYLRIALLALPAAAQAAGLANADTAIYTFAWYVIDFLAATAALVLLGKFFIATMNTEDRGQAWMQTLKNLGLVALGYAIFSLILYFASKSGTELKGIDTAVQAMHQ